MFSFLRTILLSRGNDLPHLPTAVVPEASKLNALVQETSSKALQQAGGKTLETLVLSFIVPVIFNLGPAFLTGLTKTVVGPLASSLGSWAGSRFVTSKLMQRIFRITPPTGAALCTEPVQTLSEKMVQSVNPWNDASLFKSAVPKLKTLLGQTPPPEPTLPLPSVVVPLEVPTVSIPPASAPDIGLLGRMAESSGYLGSHWDNILLGLCFVTGVALFGFYIYQSNNYLGLTPESDLEGWEASMPNQLDAVARQVAAEKLAKAAATLPTGNPVFSALPPTEQAASNATSAITQMVSETTTALINSGALPPPGSI
jgi:hypothetical protein